MFLKYYLSKYFAIYSSCQNFYMILRYLYENTAFNIFNHNPWRNSKSLFTKTAVIINCYFFNP